MGDPMVVEPHLGIPERPIRAFDEDRLERDQFVRRVASALVDGETRKARGVVIGITGPWGSGKSSILNLLRERLKADNPDTVVVSFDPWLISGRNDLISEFINELLATIKSDPKVARKLKSITSTFAKYGRLLEPAAGYVNPMAGAALKFTTNVAEIFNSKDESLSTLRTKLLAELAESTTPIVVLIDELDRIEDQEIRTVAQLVRSVADFPGISYVLAYDHDRVVQALGEGLPKTRVPSAGAAT
jgi:predicted KAP-like P-loop ATPase